MTKFSEILTDKFGEVVFPTEELKVISTGSISLDISTGVGGIPLGRFTQLFGVASSGKTSLALAIANNAMMLGYSVLYIDLEHTLELPMIKALCSHYDPELFALAQPEYAEDAFSIAEFAVAGSKKHDIAPKSFDLIFLDSVGALSPRKEKEDELTDANVALVARLITKFLRRIAFDVRKNNVGFVFINQVRSDIGSYIGGYTPAGGNALNHYLSLAITLNPPTKSKRILEGEDVIGISARFTVTKNKLSSPFRTAEFPIIFGKGIDSTRDILNFATLIGVLKKAGAYFKYGEENVGHGENKAIEYLNQNLETLAKIENECYNRFGISNPKGAITNGTDKNS